MGFVTGVTTNQQLSFPVDVIAESMLAHVRFHRYTYTSPAIAGSEVLYSVCL